MKTAFLNIAGEGLGLIMIPILYAILGVLFLAAVPFFVLGLVKRGVVYAITHGEDVI